MKFAIAEKSHETYLDDVVTEMSQDSLWTTRLFEAKYDQQFLITYRQLEELPIGLWTLFSKYGLEFFVSKVHSSSKERDKSSIIFKFEAKDFSHIVGYSSYKAR